MTLRQISLQKGEHYYVFRYPAGQESDAVQRFFYLAGQERYGFENFNWTDAEVLSDKIEQDLKRNLDIKTKKAR